MDATNHSQLSTKSWRRKATVIAVTALLLLLFVSNPGETGFRKFLQEYEQTQSGASIAPVRASNPVNIERSNYYLYSMYAANIDGIEHHYIGMFGSFHNY
jgi:hypothetical protein